MHFHARFEPAPEGGFVVTVPTVPEAITEGDTLAEAMEAARAAISLALASYIERDDAIPPPGVRKGRYIKRVELPTAVSTKLNLYSAWLASGVRKAELARRIGIPKSNVDRLFDLTQATRLDQLEAAFRALGLRLTVQVSAA